jgi:hypothetical protein
MKTGRKYFKEAIRMRKIGLTAVILLVALGLMLSGRMVFAQSTSTLTKEQILLIDPDGKVTVAKMNMEAKMQEEMKKRAQPVTKGLRVWFDQNGQMSYLTDPAITPPVTGGAPVDNQSTSTLTKEQTLRVDPDGKVTVITIRPMNMESKIQEERKKQAQLVTKGLRVWFDQNGQLSYLTDPVTMDDLKK